jgi:serine/threonine-protein kinase
MAATLARSSRSKVRDPHGGAGLLKVGDLLAGKYRVERILGEGGMGVVVAAHHELLDQHVAVKLLYQDVADREAQSRLLLEARACAKLQSEHVARVVDVDTGADGLPFIVMELLEGSDLCQVADARGALPRWLVVDYVLQALEGLAHAHARGIVHRDLKPSNLFLANRPDGSQIIKILDFGISKSTEPTFDSSGERRRAMQLTGGRAVLGSPPYMSPEQVRSPKTVDHRTDIWSIGVVMYELLTNSMPFGGDEMNETFAQILERQPQPVRQLVHGVPEGIEHIVMRCLAKSRDSRFADVGELARALVAFGSGAWIKAADRVQATLARGVEEAHAGPRVGANTASLSVRAGTAIPSAPGRRPDSVQPEFTGTTRTVARRFTVLGPPARNLLALSGVIGTVAILLIAGTAVQRSRARAAAAAAASAAAAAAAESAAAESAAEEPVAAPTGESSGAEPSLDPAAVASAPALTATVRPAEPEGAAPPAAVAGAAGIATAGASAGARKSSPSPVARGGWAPAAAVKRPPPPVAPAKPLLPPGLPRERQ